MPNRILREGINSSPRIAAITPLAELFYRRLFAVVDDYGRYYATPQTLMGALWPTTPDRVCLQDVSKWLAECSQPAVNLLTVYEHRGAMYLQIVDFNQKERSKSKFPEPASNLSTSCGQVADKMSTLVGVGIRSSYAESEALVPAAAAATEPEPKNKPNPTPEGFDGQAECWAAVDDLLAIYADGGFAGGDPADARRAAGEVLMASADPVKAVAAWRPALRAWVAHWTAERTAGARPFITRLPKWLRDGDWARPPKATGAAAPQHKMTIAERLEASRHVTLPGRTSL
jgi:hypothetical protein